MQNPPGSYPPQQGYQPGGYQTPGGYPPAGPTGGKTQTLNLDYNVAACLSYIPICLINPIVPIIWLVTEPKSNKFVRFHALQALFLLGFYIVGMIAVVIVSAIIGIVLGLASENLAALAGIVGVLGYFAVILAFLGLSIMGAVKGYGNQMWKAPIVGNLAEKNA
jgi:uncharacterized membrane protein